MLLPCKTQMLVCRKTDRSWNLFFYWGWCLSGLTFLRRCLLSFLTQQEAEQGACFRREWCLYPATVKKKKEKSCLYLYVWQNDQRRSRLREMPARRRPGKECVCVTESRPTLPLRDGRVGCRKVGEAWLPLRESWGSESQPGSRPAMPVATPQSPSKNQSLCSSSPTRRNNGEVAASWWQHIYLHNFWVQLLNSVFPTQNNHTMKRYLHPQQQ